MNVRCEVCQKKMITIETKAHEKLKTANTLYICHGCNACIRIIDDLDETKQELRELSILVQTEIDSEG